MDIESPVHLDRLRNQPEIKAAILRRGAAPTAAEARFDRAVKNTLYWPALEAISARFIAAGRAEDTCETLFVYGQPCRLLAATLGPSADAPYILAIVGAEGAPVDTLFALLQSVCRDYWFGSYFFK